jgi:hypothetical protein
VLILRTSLHLNCVPAQALSKEITSKIDAMKFFSSLTPYPNEIEIIRSSQSLHYGCKFTICGSTWIIEIF